MTNRLTTCARLLPLMAIAGGCAGPLATSGREAARNAPLIDDSMVPLCLDVLTGNVSVKDQLAAHPLARKMSDGMREQVAFTPEEFAAAAFSGSDDDRFSWRRLHDNAVYVRPFAAQAQARLAQAVPRDLALASQFVSAPLRPSDVLIHLVCGGSWDAYVLYFDRGAEVFLDIGWQADAALDSVMPDVEAILTHELWHMAFGEHVKTHWASDYKHDGDTAALFIYEMVNEGIGHYFSMRPRLYPTNTIERFTEKAAGAFALLDKNYPALLVEADEKKRSEILWRSHAGVPFWEKWGAVTGGLVADRLVQAVGVDGVRSLLASDPFSLLLAYDEHCTTHSDWPKLPAALVQDARTRKQQHVAKANADSAPR